MFQYGVEYPVETVGGFDHMGYDPLAGDLLLHLDDLEHIAVEDDLLAVHVDGEFSVGDVGGGLGRDGVGDCLRLSLEHRTDLLGVGSDLLDLLFAGLVESLEVTEVRTGELGVPR